MNVRTAVVSAPPVTVSKAGGGAAPLNAADGLHIESYIPYLVNRAATAMINYSALEFEQLGLTVPQWRILLTLWQHRECRFRELAELTSIEPPTLSRLLAGLTRDRLVKRRRHAEDSRSINLSLTAAGAALFERSLPFAENCNQIYLAGLAPEELAALRRSLATIYANVQRVRAESAPRRGAKRRGTAA